MTALGMTAKVLLVFVELKLKMQAAAAVRTIQVSFQSRLVAYYRDRKQKIFRDRRQS